MKKQIQQGDVLIERTTKAVPVEARAVSPDGARGWILARGEATGHAHSIADIDSAELYVMETRRDGVMTQEMFLRALAPVTIEHEDHRAIELDPGTYRVSIVQEWDYLTQASRNVAD